MYSSKQYSRAGVGQQNADCRKKARWKHQKNEK